MGVGRAHAVLTEIVLGNNLGVFHRTRSDSFLKQIRKDNLLIQTHVLLHQLSRRLRQAMHLNNNVNADRHWDE